MHDLMPKRRLQRTRDMNTDTHGVAPIEHPIYADPLNDTSQAGARHVFHRHPAVSVRLSGIVELHDVGMVDRQHRLYCTNKSLRLLVLAREFGIQYLECDG